MSSKVSRSEVYGFLNIPHETPLEIYLSEVGVTDDDLKAICRAYSLPPALESNEMQTLMDLMHYINELELS